MPSPLHESGRRATSERAEGRKGGRDGKEGGKGTAPLRLSPPRRRCRCSRSALRRPGCRHAPRTRNAITSPPRSRTLLSRAGRRRRPLPSAAPRGERGSASAPPRPPRGVRPARAARLPPPRAAAMGAAGRRRGVRRSRRVGLRSASCGPGKHDHPGQVLHVRQNRRKQVGSLSRPPAGGVYGRVGVISAPSAASDEIVPFPYVRRLPVVRRYFREASARRTTGFWKLWIGIH